MNRKLLISKIVSGGQTGVDQGALDAAIWMGIPHGGWCPKGRRSEDGAIPSRFELMETEARDYAVRTEQNVVDSDGTLIIYHTALTGGTAYTLRMAKKHQRPFFAVDLEVDVDFHEVLDWIRREEIRQLNVAGPRESSSPGICEAARQLMISLFRDAMIE